MIDALLCHIKTDETALILDLATGTGDSAYEALKRGLKVVGVDTSLQMMQLARQKYCKYFTDYHLASASGYALPFKDEVFSGATCAFGIRNMPETMVVLKELHRVLKPSSALVILEFTPPSGFLAQPYRFYLHKVMPFVAKFFTAKSAYEYLANSIEAFHKPAELQALILKAGFSSCDIIPLCMHKVLIHKAVK